MDLAAASMACGQAVAGEWAFAPRVVAGATDYELSTPGTILPGGVVWPDQTFQATFLTLGVGATAFKDRFYFDAYAQTSTDESDKAEAPSIPYTEQFEGDRDEFTFSVSYGVTDRAALYIGYKHASTSTTGDKGGRSEFVEDGYFAGATYGWPIGKYGVLSANLALADLDGETRFRVTGFAPGFNIDAVGEAAGLTYGLAWRSRLTGKFGYAVTLDSYKYTFKDNVDKTFGRLDGEIEEKLLSLKVAVSYEFD